MAEHEWKARVRDEEARKAGYPIGIELPGGLYGISLSRARWLRDSLAITLSAFPDPGAAPSSRPTVKVRISVDVDDDGQHGVGYDDDAATEEYERAFGPTGRKRHIVHVTADVPLPEAPPEVNGEVAS